MSATDAGTILVVDDDPRNLKLLSDTLSNAGFEVGLVMNGMRAIELAKEVLPDLILLDVRMEGIDGYETCRRLKADPLTIDIPVIFMTANADLTTDRVLGLKLGAVDYIIKPFQNEELLARVQVHTRLRRVMKNLAQEIQERTAAEQALAELVERLERRTEELHEANERVSEMAHRAGMAEVATNILHNVGNVLTSLKVSSEKLAERIANSRAPSVKRLANLLEEKQGELSDFFTSDPRGKQLPTFVKVLADQFAREQERNTEEVDRVRRHIEAVRGIIALQQSVAGGPRLVVPVQVPRLLEDALSITGTSSRDPGYTIVRDYAALPGPCRFEKHRVLQILVNLINNADQALQGAPEGVERILTLRVRPRGEHAVCIEVADNGSGIAPESLPRLFTFGFTTRSGGHGFGLHSCAVNAKAMQGEVYAASGGVGKGATFSLILPRNGSGSGDDVET